MTALRGYGGLHFSSACEVLIRDFDEIYPEWAKLAKIASVIPVSSVPGERGFSLQNRIKTVARSRLRENKGKMAEENKKIPRARKAMKPSDRQQLESLHSILLTGPLSNPSPPPLLNEQNNTLEPNSPHIPAKSPPVSSAVSDNQATGSSPAKTAVPGVRPKGSVVDLTEDDDEVQVTGVKNATAAPPSTTQRPPQVISIPNNNQATGSSPAKTAVPGVRPKGPVVDLTEDDDEVQVTGVKNVTAAPPSTTQRPPQVISIPNIAPEEKCSTSGLKRTLSETVQRDVKRPKADVLELEAERKITAEASSHLKLEKTKIARLAKTFGEANQVSENKRKQETAAAASAAAAATAAATAAKTAAAAVWETFVNNSIACYKPAANITVDKQVLPTKARCYFTQYMANEPDKFGIKFWLAADVDSKYVVNGFPYLGKDENRPAHQHLGEGERGDEADGAILPPAQPTPAPTSTAMVTQSSILQLITSSSKAVTTLATGITTQTPTGTLLLKTAAGSNMMGPGQPLLIQLPLSMTNGQTGTLVNFPVSSLSAANSLNKGKTSTTTTTYILKPAPIITVATSSSVADTVSALQASTGQMSPGQISLARVVYSGGTGGINTPKAGVSVTAARTPAQSVSVAGAMSSASSPATSGPAATGSTAPGPPQGTSMTSKTDNQATGSSPAKTAVPGVRPKGSVIDLTEDDDEVQGVKNVTAAPPSTTQRPPQVISIPNIAGARSSPQSNLPTSSNPQLTVHHRPPLDSPIKSRAVSSTTPTRASTMSLPPLPSAPAPPGRLPPEAAQTSPPQQPQLKLVPSQTGIVLSWCVSETDRTCATVESYHLYAFHQDNSSSNNAAQQHWKKFGEVEALPLPMACALTRFQSGSTYHFAVRAKDIYGRFGSFCEPQCTNGINSSSS
ncbi:uncharacterized protein ACN63O_021716 [Diretmus argenteus]